MGEKPISPLRQRMLEDMNVRRFSPAFTLADSLASR
jgi:hypothetical protein